ncbi:MAG: T9SS type A sorting domain-containing protein, partial [Bacteroidota bacterium]
AGPSGAINPPTYVGFSTFNNHGFPDPSGGGSPSNDFGGGSWGVQSGGGANGSYATFKSRVFRNDNFARFVPKDYEIRFTASGGFGWQAFTNGLVVSVPFELWCIGSNTPTDPSDDYRMIPWVLDEDGDDAFGLQQADHNVSGGDNDPYTDWIYWYEPNPLTPGTAGYDAFVAAGGAYDGSQGTGDEVMARVVLVSVNGGSVSDVTWPANLAATIPATGNVIRIVSTKPLTVADAFTVNTAAYASVQSATAETVSLNRINVFPNPYYGSNPLETNRFQRFVTFNNLPPKAKVRIFNLAGQLVRVLDKEDTSQFLQWNLLNFYNVPVASGFYIVHMEFPELGESKILKLSIIQEQEVFDSY